MIRILIIDDNSFKANKIASLLKSIIGCSFDTASDVVSARGYLKNFYNFLLLDINLPERFGDTPQKDKGVEFLEELKKSNRLKFPDHVIGLTEFDDVKEKVEEYFKQKGFVLIKYDNKAQDWQDILKEKIEQLIKTEQSRTSKNEYEYDIAFITALRTPELDGLLRLNYQWEPFKMPNDPSTYHKGKIELSVEQTLNVIATSLPQMGMSATAVTSTKIINNFKPRFLIMTGICGGIKGKVTLGDIVITDNSFDFGSGKVIKDEQDNEKFEPDFRSIPLSGDYKEDFIDLASKKAALRAIQDSWMGNNVSTELTLHIGPVGSGAAVIANLDYTKKIIEHQRKLLAIDMETYSIFYSCEYANSPKPIPLSIKAVCDYADHEKNDDIQKYCSFISAKLADLIIKEILFK